MGQRPVTANAVPCERPVMAVAKSLSLRRRHAPSREVAPWRRRLSTRRQRQALDRALAAGADPRADPKLGARATALTSQREREALAAAIYRVLKAARRDRPSFSMQVPVARRAIELNRPELLALAAELRQAPTVSARGVAAISVLVTDAVRSPLYRSGAPRSLNAALSRARRWL
jgi:hypothetical protein